MFFFAKCKQFWQLWCQRTEGSMAVEFALVCVPFIYLTIAIIEISLFFAGANMLESGVNASARMIRTGQLQSMEAADQEVAFRTNLCSQLFVLIDCNNVDLEVIHIPDDDFGSADGYTPVYDESGRLVSHGFDAGDSDEVVLIRVAYRYQLWTPLFSSIFSVEPDHTIPLLTTVVLQTEPYTFDSSAS